MLLLNIPTLYSFIAYSILADNRKTGLEFMELILLHKWSQKSLIESANRKLTGWVPFQRCSDVHHAFAKLDSAVEGYLERSAKK